MTDPDDDVTIEDIGPKKPGESENDYIQRPLSDKQIAYIEPHGATNNTDPEMPHLVVKMPGPQGLKVRYKLLVEYKRGNGYRAPYVKEFTRPEDTVKIPADGDYTPEMDADQEWRIFETQDWLDEINGENGFFGGTAKLYIWFPSQGAAPTEPFMTFRIGGKNPDPAKAKTFINSEAGSQFSYAYAIAKHETFGRVREDGQIRFYNQFYTNYKGGPIGDASLDMGWAAWAKAWPLYNLDRYRKNGVRYQNGPGGYGMYQLTLGPKEPDATIPPGGEGFIKRKEIWNWQDNVRGAIHELQGKVSQSQKLFNGLQTTYPGSGSIPNYQQFSGLDAIVITYYNGMYGGQLQRVQVKSYSRNPLSCWTAQNKRLAVFTKRQRLLSCSIHSNGITMKSHLLISLLLCCLLVPCVAGETTNPVQDYATFHELPAGRVVYKWQVDLNNDGRDDMLLDTKLTSAEMAEENAETQNRYDPDVHGFTVYIAKADGSGYVMSTGVDNGVELGLGVVPEIDITQCFVGQITQLNKRGLVTIQTDFPRSGADVARIYAYTIEGDHLKQTLLAEYDPEQGNAIYDQYLSESHRTQVQLQEITL